MAMKLSLTLMILPSRPPLVITSSPLDKPSVICLMVACMAASPADATFLELLDFLGQWTDEQGTAIDFDMFNESSADGAPEYGAGSESQVDGEQ